jgi:RHS repeat-associated protein
VWIEEKDAQGTATSVRRYVWADGTQPAEERDGSNTVLRRFYPEGEQAPGAAGPSDRLFYAKDHLGSVRDVTDAAGVLRARYDYDFWGKRTRLSGDVNTAVGYTGHHHHGKSGLVLTWYRAYEPDTGRWLSRDPIEEDGGLNLYGYVFNNPINLWDPLGLFELTGNEIVDAGLESFSRAAQGVVNAFTGGLFNPKNGIFYDAFNKQWEDLGEESNDCNDDFATGSGAGGFAATTLASGAAPLVASRFSSVLANSSSIGRGSTLFGRGGQFGQKGIFNQGNFRTGWGWKGNRTSGRDVFRSSWSNPGNRTGSNHFDWF